MCYKQNIPASIAYTSPNYCSSLEAYKNPRVMTDSAHSNTESVYSTCRSTLVFTVITSFIRQCVHVVLDPASFIMWNYCLVYVYGSM